MGQSAVKAMAKAKTEAVWPEGTIPGSASKRGALWGTPPGQAGFEEPRFFAARLAAVVEITIAAI